MARVFLSHAQTDLEFAEQVHEALRADGHEVFLAAHMHDGIEPGDAWEIRLQERLRWADVVVCVVTRAFVGSVWCTAEIGFARSRGSRVVPVLAEPGVSHPLLTALQHIDATRDASAARARLADVLRRVDTAGGRGWLDGRSPYPGLRPFSTEEHRAFFGRDADVAALAAQLRAPVAPGERSVLLVVGPSGSGKSSLVRAGLLPVLAEEPEWLVVPAVVPGRDPISPLARELTTIARDLGRDWSVADVRRRLDDGSLAELATDLLLAAPRPRPRQLLVVVDQFEELLTQTAAEPRRRVARLLGDALAGPVRVVGTLRPEFLARLQVDPELADLPTTNRELRPLRGDDLREVIERPAQLAGIALDAGLTDRLVADTGSGEALPLLAFTLQQLCDGVDRGGRLRTARYEELGGVQGALTRQADAALTKAVTAGGRTSGAVMRELLRLVTVDEHSRPTRGRVAREELSAAAAAELDCFVAGRLCTTDTEDGVVVVGVAHEAFLSTWPPLAAAVEEALSALRARRGIEQAAEQWEADGWAPARLWEHGQLAAALQDVGARTGPADAAPPAGRRAFRRPATVVAERVELSGRARDFLATSRRRDRRRRRRSTSVLSVLLVLTLAGAGVAVSQTFTARSQRDLAVHNQILSQADRLQSVDHALAAQLDLVAERMRPTSDLFTALVASENTALPRELAGHTDTVKQVAHSPDGRLLATVSADRTLRLWNLADPQHPATLGEVTGDSAVNAVAFRPDGRLLVTGHQDGTVRLWSTDGPTPVPVGAPLTGHTRYVAAVAFGPDGRTVASAGGDRAVRLWDVADPAAPTPLGAPLTGHERVVNTLDYSPDGRTLASGSNDGTVRLWDVADPAAARPLGSPLSHGAYFVLAARFSPDGHTLAVGSGDRSIRLWDVADPARAAPVGQPLTGHTDFVNALAFSRDGQTLASGSGDHTVRLWNTTDRAAVSPLGGPLPTRATVLSLDFAPDGRSLVSGGQRAELLDWDLPGDLRVGAFGYVQKYSHAVVYSPDGRTLASGSADGSVRLWDTADPDRPAPRPAALVGHTAYVSAVTFSPNGRLLASGSDDATVRLWDVADPARPVPVGGPLTGHDGSVWALAFSPDGRLLATSDHDGGLLLWDVSRPEAPVLLGQRMAAHEGAVNAVQFSPDGRTLATGSGDYTVRLWNVTDPAHVVPRTPPLTAHSAYVNAVVYSPDGRLMATGSGDTTVRLWDVADPDHPVLLPPRLEHNNPVFALAFRPDGRTLASGAADHAVWLWDVSAPDRAVPLGRPLVAHTDTISGLAFSPDGRRLVSGSRDQTMRLWDLDVDPAVQRICAVTAGALTPEAWSRYVSTDLHFAPPCPGVSG